MFYWLDKPSFFLHQYLSACHLTNILWLTFPSFALQFVRCSPSCLKISAKVQCYPLSKICFLFMHKIPSWNFALRWYVKHGLKKNTNGHYLAAENIDYFICCHLIALWILVSQFCKLSIKLSLRLSWNYINVHF